MGVKVIRPYAVHDAGHYLCTKRLSALMRSPLKAMEGYRVNGLCGNPLNIKEESFRRVEVLAHTAWIGGHGIGYISYLFFARRSIKFVVIKNAF